MAEEYSFKVYGGAHNGLVFELRQGSYTIGSSDDNDLIFNDPNMPAQAAVLTLTAEGLELELFNDVKINGETVGAGRRNWTSGEFLQLGDTLLCYRSSDIKGEWPHPHFEQQGEATAETEPKPAEEVSAEGKAEEAKASDQRAQGEETQPETLTWKQRYLQLAKRYWALEVAAALLAVLVFFLILGPVLFSKSEEEHDLERVQHALAAYNFESVTAEQSERGVLIYGSVSSKVQYARLCDALPKLRTFLTVNVEVRDDEILSVERDFQALGYYVRAHYIDDNNIAVEGYFKDAYVQADAFRAMEPKYRSRLKGRIIYQPDLAAALSRETTMRGINELKLLFGDGEVFYAGKTTIEDENDIELIRHGTAIRLGIPLRLSKYDPKDSATIARFDGINVTEAAQTESELEEAEKERLKEAAVSRSFYSAPVEPNLDQTLSLPKLNDAGNGKKETPAEAKEQTKEQTKEPVQAPTVSSRGDTGRDFSVKDIMGVTLKPMRFISLKNGRKYFEGGVLPNGYTVSKIDLDKVVITKGNEVIELRLTK